MRAPLLGLAKSIYYYFPIFKRSVTLIKRPFSGIGSLCSVIHRENSGPLQRVLYWLIIRKKLGTETGREWWLVGTIF